MQHQSIKMQDAIARMRQLSKVRVPFSFGFISYNASTNSSDGYKVVDNAVLRTGLREDQSELHNILIAYTEIGAAIEKPRQFYLPLLMMFNGLIVTA